MACTAPQAGCGLEEALNNFKHYQGCSTLNSDTYDNKDPPQQQLGNSTLLFLTSLPWCLFCHLLLPLLPPQRLSPVGPLQCHSQTSSQAALWGEDTEKHLFMVQMPVPHGFMYNGAGTLITNSHSAFSLPDRIILPTMKVSFLKDHEFTTLKNLGSLVQGEPKPPRATPLI